MVPRGRRKDAEVVGGAFIAAGPSWRGRAHSSVRGDGGTGCCQEPGRGRRRRGCRPRAWSTSPAGRRRCHWAMGRRAWASMSAQCCRGWPEAQAPSATLPTGSARSREPRAQMASTRSTLWAETGRGAGRGARQRSVWPPGRTCPLLQAAYLDLAQGHEEGESLVEVGGGRALPGRRPSRLPLLPVQHELDLHVGLWAGGKGSRGSRV